MIYITSDTHSDFSRFITEKFPIQTEMTKNNYVIICGDFGRVWTFEEESSREKEALDWLNKKTLLHYLLMEIMKTLQDYIII